MSRISSTVGPSTRPVTQTAPVSQCAYTSGADRKPIRSRSRRSRKMLCALAPGRMSASSSSRSSVSTVRYRKIPGRTNVNSSITHRIIPSARNSAATASTIPGGRTRTITGVPSSNSAW